MPRFYRLYFSLFFILFSSCSSEEDGIVIWNKSNNFSFKEGEFVSFKESIDTITIRKQKSTKLEKDLFFQSQVDSRLIKDPSLKDDKKTINRLKKELERSYYKKGIITSKSDIIIKKLCDLNDENLTSFESFLKAYEPYIGSKAISRIDTYVYEDPYISDSNVIHNLSKKEELRVLYKTILQSSNPGVYNEWFKVVLDDGSEGFVLPDDILVYESEKDISFLDENSKSLEDVNWRTPEFRDSILYSRYDFKHFDPDKKLLIDSASKLIVLNTVDFNMHFSFETIQIDKTRNGILFYKFIGIDNFFIYPSEDMNSITLNFLYNQTQYSIDFVRMDIEESEVKILYQEEARRRNELLNSILSKRQTASFNSRNYGFIEINDDKSFSWSGFDVLYPKIIPQKDIRTGMIDFDIYPSSFLADNFTGALNFVFNDNSKISFLFKVLSKDEQGTLNDTLILTYVPNSYMDGNLINRTPNLFSIYLLKN